MICPLRFKEFTSEPEMQECRPDCAWLVKRDREHGEPIEACAVAVLARRNSAGKPRWKLANRLEEGGTE